MQLLNEKKLKKLEQQKHCPYCGNELKPNLANVDHLIPRCRLNSLHGEERRDFQRGNTILSCATCNKHKGRMMPLEFLMGCHTVGGECSERPLIVKPFKYNSRHFVWRNNNANWKKAPSSSG